MPRPRIAPWISHPHPSLPPHSATGNPQKNPSKEICYFPFVFYLSPWCSCPLCWGSQGSRPSSGCLGSEPQCERGPPLQSSPHVGRLQLPSGWRSPGRGTWVELRVCSTWQVGTRRCVWYLQSTRCSGVIPESGSWLFGSAPDWIKSSIASKWFSFAATRSGLWLFLFLVFGSHRNGSWVNLIYFCFLTNNYLQQSFYAFNKVDNAKIMKSRAWGNKFGIASSY